VIPPLDFIDSTHVRRGKRSLVYFGGCNYLGLSGHPRVLASMRNALKLGLTQPGASRRTTGEHPLYRATEKALARFLHFPAVALANSGYLAPLFAIQALRTKATHAVLDHDTHPCLIDAAAISGLPVLRASEMDSKSLAKTIRSLPRRAKPVVLLEGTHGTTAGFSRVDKALADLPRNGWLIVDDAHGIGAVGPQGRGVLSHFQLRDPRIVLTLSLAKALGVAGGAVAGAPEVIQALRDSSPAYAGSTPLPLAAPAGVLESIQVFEDEPGRLARLQMNMRSFHDALKPHAFLSNSPHTPVTRWTPDSPSHVQDMTRRLLRAGIFPSFIRYPVGPSAGYFRFAINSEHQAAEFQRLAECLQPGTGR